MEQTAYLAAALPLPSVLSNPLYAFVAMGLLLFFGVLCKTKFDQPIIAIVCLLPALYIGYVLFSAFAN